MELTPEQSARLGQWFDEAVGLPLPAREALIARVRRDEGDEMADELVGLLKANSEPTDTMEPLAQFPNPAAQEETSAFREGEVILGRFRIVRVLGRGGMGEVYEAQDQELGPVALKTIRRDLLGDRAVLRRFKQEVQLARQVTSPYICRIHELFMLPDIEQHRVAAFLTMELLEGTTLAKRIEQGPLPWSEAEPIAIELCQGLEALHTMGLVHRDFKPANAMLARRGNVTQAVVMDLGLAQRPKESLRGRSKLTLTGGTVGTPGYMAPEQFEGARISAATDIYALGLVLYEMTTGKRPFEASTPLAAAVKRGKRLPTVSSIRPGLPRRLDRVIEKCLEFEPADRFRSAGAVATALSGVRGISWGFLRDLRGDAPARAGRVPSRRALLYWCTAAVAAGAAATWFWPDLEMWRHPLPARRFVAAMIWPKLVDPQSASVVSQLLATISRELARAEAYDKEFLILDSGATRGYAAVTPAEAAGILGANLVLAASVLPSSSGLEIALSVLDPANTSNPLRQDTVSGSTSTLPHRAAETAARLLGVRLGPDSSRAGDDLSNVRPAAYQLFLGAQDQMSLPNNEGLDSAIEKYQAALREDPRFAAAYAGLAIAFGRRYAFHKDQSNLALAGRNSKLALEYGPASSRALFSQALIKLYSGDTEEAVRMFHELLKADPGNEEVLMYEAQAFRDMNKAELEERVYQNLLTQRPNYWPAYNDLGLIYREKGAYQDSVKYFRQATAIAPRAAIPWTNLGAVYLLLGKTEEGRNACLRAIANHPNEDALLNLGNVAYEAHDYGKALDYYERARDINPNGHMIWRNIGDCYTMLHQPKQTQKSYQKAAEILTADLQINPRHGSGWMTLAYYSAKLGDRSRAKEQLAEAEKRGAPDLDSQLLKAQILVLLGEKEKGLDLALDLLKRGISRVEVILAVDLQSVLSDPRLRAALQKSK
jgi:eukaryotic-like serine/threonine-protein kinase